jgi:hypothetical protein
MARIDARGPESCTEPVLQLARRPRLSGGDECEDVTADPVGSAIAQRCGRINAQRPPASRRCTRSLPRESGWGRSTRALRALGVTVPRPGVYGRADRPWTRDEDAVLRREPGAHPAALACALGRSDHAICARARVLGPRVGRERSPHHMQPPSAGLTPGEERVLMRELTGRDGGTSRVLAVSSG